jgi:hypothetical protein
VTNIRPSTRQLRVYTNGGTQTSRETCTLKNFGDIWFNAQSLANILSLAEVRRICRVAMDTSIEAAMDVHRANGTIMKFQEYRTGLYYFDTDAPTLINPTKTNAQDYLFLNTVAGNKGAYTRGKIQGADRARELYIKLLRPSQQEYTEILQGTLIQNCPVTPDDAKRAVEVRLQGGTVKKQNSAIPNYQAVQIPAPIIAKYSNVRLFIDIFWVNDSPYFHTISEWIKFCTVAAIKNRTKNTLLMETQVIINMYEIHGFHVTRVEGDREFSCITQELLPTPINIADADDHVHEVERSI